MALTKPLAKVKKVVIKMPLIFIASFGHIFTLPHIHESQNLKQYLGGDIQKFSEKLPGFVWAKYKGEKHITS